jgi:hypothetical protein
MHRVTLIAVVLVLPLTVATSATAISGGTVDGTTHPNVGALLVRAPSGEYGRLCSGVLISPTAFLTHAFCVGDLESVEAEGGRFYVTFDSVIDVDRGRFNRVAGSVVHPDVHWPSFRNVYGIAVLARPVRGVTPAQLPTLGLLDTIDVSEPLTAVGYGESADCSGAGQCTRSYDGVRRWAPVEIAGLNPDTIELQTNAAATGAGGLCRGDNGAPLFHRDTNVVVGVAAAAPTGGCHAVMFAYRNDTALARSFLDDFAPVP